MWEWFNANSIWILIASIFLLLLFLIIQGPVRNRIIEAAAENKQKQVKRRTNIITWSIEGILFVIAANAFVVMVISYEGAASLITPESIQEWFLGHGVNLFIILLAAIGMWYFLNKFLPLLVRHTMVRTKGESKDGIKKRTDTLVSVLNGAGRILIIIFLIFMLLTEIGVEIGPILAGFGIAGIAVGFGAQYLVKDLIAGIFVLMENQYRVGDVARVADVIGVVEDVTLRKTVLRDLDGIVHHVPNGEIRVASNYSRHFSRVNLDISVSYGTDLDHAIKVLNRVCQELAADEHWGKLVIKTPYVLRVNNLGDSGIDIKLTGEVKPTQQWAVMGELRLRVKKAFDAEGIEIPWPHTKVYFGNAPGDQS